MQSAPLTSLPSSIFPLSVSITTGRTPKNGNVAEPGLVGVAPGSGLMRTPPVSVCHQVSTTAHRPSPGTSWYHFQTSGLMGSPTVPSTRSDLREYRLTQSSPAWARARRAVGAV